MRENSVHYLACPQCQGDLTISSVEKRSGGVLETAELACIDCTATYPIVDYIPRFVPNANYASNFGHEWTIHARTQYDSTSGVNASEKRFFEETGWPIDLTGEVILEAGSGSGRFTEQAAKTNAFVVSFDYSFAVEANYASNGGRENVLIVQADIYHMPFREGSFDKVFCIGVLQHTPDVEKAFLALPPMLKSNGDLVVDVYKKTIGRAYMQTKYYVRFMTRNMEPTRLYQRTKRWIDFIWPLAVLIRKIPRIGPILNWRLLVPDYSREGVPVNSLKEWAYLDAFDMLSPRYDSPQTIKTVQRWFEKAGMAEVVVKYGYNGIEGHGKKAVESTSNVPHYISSTVS
ncbi:MAG TPA: methyltransferase domain-containing protein [Ktedonobacteraceae bacterium]|nr:methyltransferase domain-containing protein [Ktedonobacteraceae bacterium]